MTVNGKRKLHRVVQKLGLGMLVACLLTTGLVPALPAGLTISQLAGMALGPKIAHAALFGSFGIKDEQELGRKFAIIVRSRLPLVEDPEVKLYVQSIVDRLAQGIPPQPFPFDAHVLLHHTMNAFAVPGGNVFVHTGLISELEHESELAGVLAHELAHVTQRHVASRIERAQVLTIGSLLGALAAAFLGGGQAGGALAAGSLAAGQAAMLNYSRQDETTSDQVGLQYMIKAGYRPQGMTTAFEKIRHKQWSTGIDIPEYLSTHPDVSGRVNETASRIKGLPEELRNRPEHNEQFLRVKALVTARYQDVDVAIRYFADPSRHSNTALALMGQGILAFRRNRVPEAHTAFAAALKAAPNDALIWREAGRFYYSCGDKRAESALHKALELDRDDTMAQFFYARTLDAAGDKLTAHRYYEQVLRSVPEDIEVHYVYGRSLGESGKAFSAYVHLSYSATYENNGRKLKPWLKQARATARSEDDKRVLKRLEDIIKERREYWEYKQVL